MQAERECGNCGGTFTPARSDSMYCSGRCRQAAYRSRSKVRGERSDTGWPVADPGRRYGKPAAEPCCQLIEEPGARTPDGLLKVGGVHLCTSLAVWRLWKQDNHGSHPGAWAYSHWCEEHLPGYLARYDVAGVSETHASVRPR